MSSDEHDRDRLIRRLFALLMTRLEEGAALALEGQGRDCADHTDLAGRLIDRAGDIQTIAEAILLIVAANPEDQNRTAHLG